MAIVSDYSIIRITNGILHMGRNDTFTEARFNTGGRRRNEDSILMISYIGFRHRDLSAWPIRVLINDQNIGMLESNIDHEFLDTLIFAGSILRDGDNTIRIVVQGHPNADRFLNQRLSLLNAVVHFKQAA